MRCPDWAAAGSFPRAWVTAERDARSSALDWHRSLNADICEGLSAARIISVSRDQVEALPLAFDGYEDSAAASVGVRLPFDPLFLSLGGARLTRYEPHGLLLGAMVGRIPGSDALPTGEPVVFPFVDIPGHGPQFSGYVYASPDGWVGRDAADVLFESDPDWLNRLGGTDKDYRDGQTMKADAAEIIAAVLYFLESANVELVEGQPSRQERRAVERKGGAIALTVAIRQSKKRTHQEGEPAPREWSHRWEVRGHYKHFPAGTKLADAKPDTLVGHPTLGRCRRIWCPPYVKGPEDKPLVPKLRVVESMP